MEDTAIHWHHCQGMSLGPYEVRYLDICAIFLSPVPKKALYFEDVNGILDHLVFL